MLRRLYFLALIAAGCSPAASPSAQRDAGSAIPSPRPVTSLAGAWRVAAINGIEFNEPYGLALTADDKEIWWDPRCAGHVRSYRIAGTAFSSGPRLGFTPRKPGEPTPPVCAVAAPPRTDEAFRAITSARTIRRTQENGVELAGGGRSLLLFSQ